MKKLLLSCVIALIAARSWAGTASVQVRLVDDLGVPVEGATVELWFNSFLPQPEDHKTYVSDHEGMVQASGETPVGVSIYAHKAGYYEARSKPSLSARKPIKRTYVLPRVLKPIPLCVVHPSFYLTFPAKDVWLDYDLESADWLPPYGRGKVADLRFKFSNEFKGYLSQGKDLADIRNLSKAVAKRSGQAWSEEEFKFSAGKWDGVVEIAFPGKKEGLVEEKDGYWAYAQLKLPRLAPESGYGSNLRLEANTYKGRPERREEGYYLRTRVKLDAEGNIVSANYAKIYNELYFDARGTLSICYYFNPTPNDRNLEFDLKHNMLTEKLAGGSVFNP